MKVVIDAHDYLGCDVNFDNKNSRATVEQLILMKILKGNVLAEVEYFPTYNTPSAPHYKTVRPNNDVDCIEEDQQKIFRSGIGMLLYLVKHTKPDLDNPVRELSKVMDGATMEHYRELMIVVKFSIDTENKALSIWPTKKNNGLYMVYVIVTLVETKTTTYLLVVL